MWENLYLNIVIAILNGTLICFTAGKMFQMLQLSGYKLSGYFTWLKDTKIKFVGRILMLAFLSLFSMLVSSTLLDSFGSYYSYLSYIFYFYFNMVFIINMTKIPQKNPLKQTKRMNRLIITVFVIIALMSFFMISVCQAFVPFIRHAILVLTPIAALIVVPIAHIINLPVEYFIRLQYIKRAKAKLAKMPNLIKIGITGSFGKTSTKHILNVILSKKYSVCMTPHSFNTPMGLTKVILKYLKKDNQILIAEMGAKNVGDIRYLCNLVEPKHAIITAVGSQHLATFGSVENVAKTKYELVEAITDGMVVFNGNNQGALKLYDKCDKTKLLSGIDNQDAFCNITNVSVDEQGSTFTLNIGSEYIYCTTKLLGRHNLEDIAMACALAYKLGVSTHDIASAVAELKPMSHRMEVIKNNNLIILDNSYNSSVESSKASLETLQLFKTGKKIIVTPGIVEMGEKEIETNIQFGKNIAKVCDKVVIVNKANLDAIKQGLQQENFNPENIFEAESLNKAKELFATITSPGDVILFENDLPDNYT